MNSKLKINRLNNKSLTEKSKQWLKKHMNDEFVRKAQKDGYICRAAYKLIEIQEKFKLIQKSHNVIELGSSPGGWSQVLTQIIHNGKIFAIDLLPMKFIHHKIFFVQGDFVSESEKILEKINFYKNIMQEVEGAEKKDIINENKILSEEEFSFQKQADIFKNELQSSEIENIFENNLKDSAIIDQKNIKKEKLFKTSENNFQINGVLSDMSPNVSGDNKVDHWRILDLLENAFYFSKKHLAKGGYFIGKIFFGGEEKEFVKLLKQDFKEVHFFKPDSSRKQSSEIYIVARHFLKK
jgi:23S rRNA U2552 (ribose-2'-O)-methylase RlmE/FtsJ